VNVLLLAAGLAAASPSAKTQPQAQPAAESAWPILAAADLREIRALLNDNHPGPVDPENPAYAQRLESNYRIALARAAMAKSFFDYKRAILSYTNGFRDGHTAAYFTVEPVGFPWAAAFSGFSWPGFAVRRDEHGAFLVTEADRVAGIEKGDALLTCDGKSIDALMKERVDPFYWNADIPHERWLELGRLFAREAGDDATILRSCRFHTASGDKDVVLDWRQISHDRADQLRARPGFGTVPALRKLGEIWHVVLPTFLYQTPESIAQIKKLIEDVKANAEAMRRGTVVFDVRGNGGGSSEWGLQIAEALWGTEWINRIVGGFDGTVDWRASPANLAMMDRTIARYENNGLTGPDSPIRSFRKIRDGIAAGIRDGKPLLRMPNPADPQPASPPPNPFSGRAFLLTDGACASACLDFADVVTRLPNATQIGEPTSADTVYIDNSNAKLPSGIAGFSYSMKVYRHRVRGNNQWYEPKDRWPAGPQTEETLRRWIESLAKPL
jgi:hypothetical protein